MRGTVMFGAGDVRLETVPDARLIEPTDALVVVTRAAICGSDLWPYKTMEFSETGRRMGHEAIGIVEAVGADVRTLKFGNVVVMPFAYSDGTCVFCHEGLHTSCIHGGFFGTVEVPGSHSRESSAQQTSSASEATRRLSACASSPTASASTPSSSASDSSSRCARRSASRVRVAQWAALVFPRTRRCPRRGRHSITTSP